MTRPYYLLLLAAAGGTPDYGVAKDSGGTVNGSADTGTDLDQYLGATLEIVSPQSGVFLPLGEEADFEAVVLDAEGEPLEWTEVAWASDIDSAWGSTNASFADDSLAVGQHTISARATLPNGAIVSDRAGAVLVQHEDAGTYVGNMILDVTGEFEGTPLTASCVGAALVQVDATGELAAGNSECVIALFGFSQNATVLFDLEVDNREIIGAAAVDLQIFQVDFDTEGELSNGVLQAEWEDSVFGFADISGAMELERVTRDID